MKRAFWGVLVAAVSVCGGAVGTAAGDGEFIREWLLCGPFPNPPHGATVDGQTPIYDHTPPCVGLDTDYLVEYGGEADIAPVAGMGHTKKDGTRVEWFEHASPENKVVFRKAISKQPNVVAYAYTTVEIQEGGRYLLGLGSDEGVRVWVNGVLVHDKLIQRPIREDDDLVPVTLKKGTNRFLVKVEQGQGGWGFALRVIPEDEVFSTVETDAKLLRVTVSLRMQLAGGPRPVELVSAGETVGRGTLEDAAGSGIGGGTIRLPFPPPGEEWGALEIVVDGKACGQVDIPSLSEIRSTTFQWQVPRGFPGSVFTGTDFPRMDFEEPFWVENLVGPYAVATTFYDADCNEVTSAVKPGRYGAVVEITSATGDVYRRYVTLFRPPEAIRWHEQKWPSFPVSLPAGLGIDPGVVRKQQETLAGHLKWSLVSDLSENPYTAVLLAGLYEMAPDDPPAVDRTNVGSRDQKWWARLKEKLGILDTPHLVYLPPDYDKDKTRPWPLMLFLHGRGECGENLEMVKRHGPPKLIAAGQHFPFIVVSPQCPLGSWWRPAELALLLDKVAARYRVDADRVYCTGLSMGGFGTWSLAMEIPERFAAIAPICGGGDVGDVARIKDIPIWAFHGARDDTVPAERTQQLIDALKALGASPKFTLYPEAYHNSWDVTYDNPELYAWLLRHRRPGNAKVDDPEERKK